MLVGITGTPGTGKTAVTSLLESRTPYRVIHLNEIIKEEKLYSEVDAERDCVVADMDLVETRVGEMADPSYITVLDSHLSHHLANSVIVLRTKPDVLRTRLQKRNYSAEKVQENLEAEALDIILCEAVDWCDNVFEIDTTSRSLERTFDDVVAILDGLAAGQEEKLAARYRPGSVDWSEEFFDQT